MADAPINHDGLSTATTVGTKALKYSLLGAAAAALIPLAIFAGGGLLIGAAVGGGLGSLIGGAGIIAGIATGIAGFVSGGTYGAIGGGFLGAIKGGDQVSRENRAFRSRVEHNQSRHQNKMGKIYNDGEIKGIQEGYQMGHSEGEAAGFQKGQQFVVEQLQKHMAAEQEAAHQPERKFAGTVACKCESKAEAIIKEREVQAATPNQIS